MSVVGPVWSDFVSKNITQDVKCLHFIEEGEDMFYVAMYDKYGLEMHGYKQKNLMFWRCLLNVTERSRRAQTLPLVFVPKVYSTSQSNTVDLFIKDRECEVFIEESLVLRFLIMRERLLRLVRITPPTCYGIQIVISDKNQIKIWNEWAGIAIGGGTLITCISKGFVDRHELRGYASAVVSHRDKKFEFKLCKKSKYVEMFSTTTLRGMVRSGFWRDQWVRFYLSKDTSVEDGVVRFEVC
ncbi:hypothetical protein Tco_0538557 [Tanacetum coccineum]